MSDNATTFRSEDTTDNQSGDLSNKPIVNCHTHIFTGNHVPPHLAKTILPAPFYRLLNLTLIFRLFHWWYNGPAKRQYQPKFKKRQERRYAFNRFLARNHVLGLLTAFLGLVLFVHVFYILWDWLSKIINPGNSGTVNTINRFHEWLSSHNLLFPLNYTFLNIALVVVFVVFFKSGRNLLLFIFKKVWSFLGKLPGKQTAEVFNRYMTIGRFTFQQGQSTIFGQLVRQYPEGTGFVILPMDMEYMEAGKAKEDYRSQMVDLALIKNPDNEELKKLKTPDKKSLRKPDNKKKGNQNNNEEEDDRTNNSIFPFIFVDPRRIEKETIKSGDKIFFDYTPAAGAVILKDCFIKQFIEEYGFSGFKIYPALGYYPFDEYLLPLWKYAADKGLPIITHCVRGPMYYRGSKKKIWDYHPVFEQSIGDNKYSKLFLPEIKNDKFTPNFTNPMNFLCLLEEEFLRKWLHTIITKKPDSPLKEIFGYQGENVPLKHNLKHLKICFGHYGGDDEWNRYFEKDRYGYSSEITQNPNKGIEFVYKKGERGKPNPKKSPGKPEQIWKFVDWYSIISSMMLQYDNVYADISYILHNDAKILPLLKQTLQNPGLREKVLFGTDFYVVRNQKSDKNMLADMMGGLLVEDFNMIARANPVKFLSNTLP